MDSPIANRSRTKSMEISLTSFTDFLLRSGVKKLTEAERIRAQYLRGYRHYQDYYREFRDAVRAVHRQSRPVFELDQLPPIVPDVRGKRTNYELMVRGYKKFWATFFQEMDYRWITPPRTSWKFRSLVVRVNPELAFTNGSETHVVKMYLKKQAPSKEQIPLLLHLMQLTVRPKVDNPVISILDVRRGRLYEETAFDPRLSALLEGEAAAFIQMYRSIEVLVGEEDDVALDPDQ